MSTQRQSIHSIHNKKFWTEFFCLYESLPTLWDINNPLYKNRQVKCDAYNQMVNKLREIEPNSDREDVLRKINIFRTNFRRECNRINRSIEEGRTHQSTLWYFDLLCFLQTGDTRRERKRKLDDDGEKSIMRKRRTKNMTATKSGQYIELKRELLFEYQPNATHDYTYDLEEEPEFDYVPDDIENGLVDGKSNTTSEVQENSIQIENHHNYEVDDANDETSQQEYSQEFKNYCLQRNSNKKMEQSSENVSNEIVAAEESLDINDDSEQHIFDEYEEDNDETVTIPQFSIKASNTQTLQLQQQQVSQSVTADTSETKVFSSKQSAKYVRDVKTMTASKYHTSSKLSESSEILAKSWAIQYDELTQQQKILARKAINDILFDGCLGHLVIGKNDRVTTGNSETSKESVCDEVESGQVYEQTSNMSSAASSVAGVAKTSKLRPSHIEFM